MTLTVGGVTEKVDVTAQTPVIEAKRQTISTNVTLDELQNIPSSRDPWVVLQTVPGIIVDRVNVGGAESGQQSVYTAKGASDDDNTWNIDGIAITDMAAVGSSPTYYDFDMFQEMQVTTGGADPSNPTPGVQLNFVLRSGTNRWRASGRYYYENNDLQSDNVSSALAGTLQSYNRVEFYKDYGVEGGGPMHSRIASGLWGAYGLHESGAWRSTRTARPTCRLNVFAHGPGMQGRGPAASERRAHLCDHRARLHGARELLREGDLKFGENIRAVVHLLPRQQAEVRPRRVRDPSVAHDLEPGRPDGLVQR